jgi:Zn-dependent membrane protease YugP
MLETWLFYLIVPTLLGLWAQAKVTSAFRRYSQVRATSGLTGAEAARKILNAAQIHDVDIVQINGMLGDHYDPTQKRLCLSTATYNSPSVAAVGIAAHETGHAIKHARAYAPLQWRMTVVPVTQIASRILPFVLFGGLFFGGFAGIAGIELLKVGVLCYAVLAAFQLLTLPVEYDASRRAKVVLGQLGIIQPGPETVGVNAVLDAAALTYVAAFVAALGNLLWLLSLTGGRRR